MRHDYFLFLKVSKNLKSIIPPADMQASRQQPNKKISLNSNLLNFTLKKNFPSQSLL